MSRKPRPRKPSMRKPMSLNEALRTAAALALHVKRDDNQLVGILQYNIAAIDDARCLNNALLILIKFLLRTPTRSRSNASCPRGSARTPRTK